MSKASSRKNLLKTLQDIAEISYEQGTPIYFDIIHQTPSTFDFIASGDFLRIKNIFKQLVDEISKEVVFHEEFLGDLKPYKHLQQYLDKIRDL